ncbi:MAG: glycoside hydrolase family 88 protein [Lachnospiraceae bacterium]|nr:glycoside hydrolase family 88 protein [Lachnospiraceae bacterium]
MNTKHPCLKLISLFLSITLLAGFLPLPVLADDPEPEYNLTSTTVSDTEDNVDRVTDLAYHLYDENSDSGRRTGGFTWDTERKKRSWTYYNGIMMDAFLMLNGGDFASYVDNFYDANITNQGKVDNTGASDNYYRENELDSIPPARALFDRLRDSTTPERYANKYRRMIDYIYSVMKGFDRADGAGGNFKHKMNNANWATYQVALDGLYMAQPFFMEVANALDDGTLSAADFQSNTYAEPSSDAIYSEVTERMLWIGENLYVEDTHLYSHGWGPGAGLNGQYWLRAVGWYAAALADVISMLPDDYDDEKNCLVEIEKRLFDGMMEYQDSATGMWYNVINYGQELSGSVSNNELETSGTALIAYAMMKSYVEGYLDDTYGEAGLRAFNGTVMNYLDDGGLQNVYISSGVETSPEGYLSKEYKTNEAKGVGPLMMAATYANAAAEIHNDPAATIIGGEDMFLETNETPDFSGVSVLLEYGNGTYRTVTSEELTFGEYDPAVPELQEVDVFYKDIYCGFISVTFEEPVSPTPSFATYSLVLSGKLGVNVYMNLPGDIEEYADSYMAFFVNGKETDVPLNPEFRNRKNVAYGFTCYVNVLQMAEEITAVFHYGADNAETIENTVSVVDYLTIIKDNPSQYEGEVVDLASAIGDYGYHCQKYLNRINNLEDKYAPMPEPDTTEYDFEELADVTDIYKVSVRSGGSAVGNATFALMLDSGTTLKIYFTTKSGFEGTPDVSVQGGEAFAAERRGGRYVIAIDDLPAHKLADMNDISIMADGEYTLRISALSYVNTILKNSTADDEKKAVASIYRYYEKAMAYRGSL